MLSILCVTILPRVVKHGRKEREKISLSNLLPQSLRSKQRYRFAHRSTVLYSRVDFPAASLSENILVRRYHMIYIYTHVYVYHIKKNILCWLIWRVFVLYRIHFRRAIFSTWKTRLRILIFQLTLTAVTLYRIIVPDTFTVCSSNCSTHNSVQINFTTICDMCLLSYFKTYLLHIINITIA